MQRRHRENDAFKETRGQDSQAMITSTSFSPQKTTTEKSTSPLVATDKCENGCGRKIGENQAVKNCPNCIRCEQEIAEIKMAQRDKMDNFVRVIGGAEGKRIVLPHTTLTKEQIAELIAEDDPRPKRTHSAVITEELN